jgi:arsenite methyltransferase
VFKGEDVSCLDVGHAVIHRGPYAEAIDAEGHVFTRGERKAVFERTFRFLTDGPLADDCIGIAPLQPTEPVVWCAPPGTRRPAAETKSAAHVGRDAGRGAAEPGSTVNPCRSWRTIPDHYVALS